LNATEEQMLRMTGEFQRMVDEFLEVQCRYQAAIRQVQTKLENLDDEYQIRYSRNPIHSIQSRMKTIQSMMDKLRRRSLPVSMASAVENLTDIAGMRVICSYIEDIYTVADVLTSQDDIKVLRVRDYIKNPKPNGYRSLHLIIETPIFLHDRKKMMKVEVQIRTMSMDWWASLEHKINYKYDGTVPEHIKRELSECAEMVSDLDAKMMSLNEEIKESGQDGENLVQAV
jgi:putative GTP pyrophosphokinase